MGTAVWRGSTSVLETVESGTIRYAERVTYMQRFRGPYDSCTAFANLHYRGTTWTISIPGLGSNSFIVDDCSVRRVDKGNIGEVEVNYCFLGTPPPDQWALTPTDINPAVERNAFFADLTDNDLKKAKAAYNAASAQGQKAVETVIGTMANATLITNLINKWLRGTENFYQAGFKFQHTLHGFSNFTLTRGGFIQAPSGAFSGYIPAGLNWLREADEESWDNGIWKVTRTWIGGPDGSWDTDLYS